jgi:hypothetical protein
MYGWLGDHGCTYIVHCTLSENIVKDFKENVEYNSVQKYTQRWLCGVVLLVYMRANSKNLPTGGPGGFIPRAGFKNNVESY